jgi:hypothetical protein
MSDFETTIDGILHKVAPDWMTKALKIINGEQ